VKIKTTTVVRVLPKDNVFKIENYGEYDEVVTTSSCGNDKFEMSFPLHHSVKYNSPSCQAAIHKCVDDTKQQMLDYIERHKKK
jgi:hypothetical protein